MGFFDRIFKNKAQGAETPPAATGVTALPLATTADPAKANAGKVAAAPPATEAELVNIATKAVALAKEDKYAEAILECDRYFRCSQGEPEDCRARMQRLYGYCFLMNEDYQRAIEELNKALVMECADRATRHLAYSNLGNAYERVGQAPEALRNYQEALRYADDESDRHIVEIFIRYL